MRTITAFMLLAIMAVSCHNGRKTIDYPPQDISKIDIRYVSAGIFTVASVKCEDFEPAFRGQIRHIVIDDTAVITKIMYYIDEAPVDTARSGMDVRRQLNIYWNNKPMESICMDGGSFQRNGKLYIFTNELFDVIESMIPKVDRFDTYMKRREY